MFIFKINLQYKLRPEVYILERIVGVISVQSNLISIQDKTYIMDKKKA
jgi:hypothetical protein